jgi:hypothetical protein
VASAVDQSKVAEVGRIVDFRQGVALGTLFLAVALIVCARWFFRSELSDAVAESLRRKHRGEIEPEMAEQIEELAERLDEELVQLRGEITELSERMDFTERVLVEVRQRQGLPEPEVRP